MTDLNEAKLNDNKTDQNILKSEESGEKKDYVTEKEKEEKNESNKENESEKIDEQSKAVKRDDSTFNRFLSWWRGKPKVDANLKDEEENKEKENEKEGKETKEIIENAENETKNSKSAELTKTNDSSQSDIDKNPNDVTSRDEKKVVRSSTVTDRRLEKILEEQKSPGKNAPLAQEEDDGDEAIDTVDPRTTIDRPIPPESAAELEKTSKESQPKIAEEADDKTGHQYPPNNKLFVVLDKPISTTTIQTNHEEPVNTHSANDDKSNTVSHSEHAKTERTQPSEDEDDQQSKKMEEVIEERHQDLRKDNVQDAWRRMEPSSPGKETGNKAFRVSYTIRTETIETKKKDVDDEVELFDDSVLLNSAPTRFYEGPPPEDLEPEIIEEHARADEAATTDIDNFFELCKEDGSAPLAKDETESVPQESANQDEQDNIPQDGQESIPQTPEDIFKKLHSWDDEPTDWWTITKKKKEYEEWIKPMKEGTIRRVIIPCVEIPYQTSVRFITDWKYREEWDKTFSEIQVLKSEKQSKVIYCPVKKRDLTFETMDQEELDPPCHVLSWKKQDVIDEDEKTDTLTKKKKEIQLITHTCGIILRPAETGDKATKITILCQLEGPVDSVLKNTFLSGHPKTWLRNLKKYYKKQQQGDSKKVVYL